MTSGDFGPLQITSNHFEFREVLKTFELLLIRSMDRPRVDPHNDVAADIPVILA